MDDFRKSCLLVLMLGLMAQGVLSQESSTVIVQDMGYGYTLTAPKGWKPDQKGAREMLLNAAFSPDSTSWSKSSVVIYANVTYKTDDDQALEEVINLDIEHFTKDSPGVKATKNKEILTFTQRKKATIYDFMNPAKKNFESVAYIDQGEIVIMIVMGTRDEKLFKAAKPDFERLVLSYYWLN